ncbi:MAG: 5'/3'-nucleotidase SurE [Gemmataceae bacterium]
MKLLITNDDGIDAPGIAALYQAAARIGNPVMVAPTDALSGCSHRVTTQTPLRVCEKEPGLFAVKGTPADCVRLGLSQLAADAAWVLSGINEGGNLGADVYHSGTVAAVREAVLYGRQGIAVSHYRKKNWPIDWEQATDWIAPILADLITRPLPAGGFWNINLPHLEPGSPAPEVVYCPLDPAPLPIGFRQEGDDWHYVGDYHSRSRQPGADIDVCFRGKIAITEMRL